MNFHARRRPLLLPLLLLCCHAATHAQGAPEPEPKPQPARPIEAKPVESKPAAPASKEAAKPQQIEINASSITSTDERRRSTASKIIYGRDEIERMGDSSIGEVLKRLPGVTISGRPGRGGAPRLRGLGNGYTQILVDGERMPRGFSLDSIEPDQIERIEIIRAPTAETGARAIAGTINIVMREDFRKKQNDLRASLGYEQSRPRAIASWTWADEAGPLNVTVTGTARHSVSADATDLRTLGVDAAGTTTLDQSLQTQSQAVHDGGFISSRLRWSAGRDRFELLPYLGTSRQRSTGDMLLNQSVGSTPAPYSTGQFQTLARGMLGRFNGSWLHVTADGERLLLRLGTSLASSDTNTTQQLYGAEGGLNHDRSDDSSQRDTSITHSGKYSALLAEQHSLVAGWELQANQRTDRHITTDNGQQQLAEFGDDVQAATRRLAVYAQDEWEANARLAFNAGLRWEGINTSSDSALQRVRNRSAVWTPLAHMVWKLPGRANESSRDQVRLSLTRSYRTPTTAQLIARPTLSSRYPADGANQPTSPDRAGNPELRPEIARGLDLAFEHYLPEGGIVSANAYVRQIDNLIRSVRTLQTVSWSPVQRWVSQPQNIGSALGAGLELEAKFRLSDLLSNLISTPWPLTVRSNGSLMWSRVDGVPGPNNRLDQQPRYTANLGLDYGGSALPLSWGVNLNYTPPYTVRQLDAQFYEQGAKRVLDAYAAWRWSSQATLRLSLSNLAPRDYDSATTVLQDDGGAQRQDTLARTYRVTTLRLELRF